MYSDYNLFYNCKVLLSYLDGLHNKLSSM